MADLITIRKKLEKYILSSGHTFREVSLKIGRKDSYIQQYVKYGFPKRLNEIDRKKICQLLQIEEKELIDDELRQSSNEEKLLNLDDIAVHSTDFICIDILEAHSNQTSEQRIIGRLAINYKDFYGWCNSNPYNLKMIRNNSDSMEPIINSGSLVLYDSSVLEYAGDGLYLIDYDGQIIIKRLQKTSGNTYLLKSENPRYQDIRCQTEEITILGKAINCLNTRPL